MSAPARAPAPAPNAPTATHSSTAVARPTSSGTLASRILRSAEAVPFTPGAGANGMRIQTASLEVSSPHDPAEREASATARQITRMPIPDGSIGYVRTGSGGVFRQLADPDVGVSEPARKDPPRISRFGTSRWSAQRAADGPEGSPGTSRAVDPRVASQIQGSLAGGSPLPMGTRRFMEPRFRADFRNVRIHTGGQAAVLNRRLNANAFAVGNNVFFGEGKFRPETPDGKELIAHELTHTVQQGGAPRVPSVRRSEDVGIVQRTPPQVQREESGSEGGVLGYFADKANLIPGFRMFTIVLGVNPINMSPVARSAANILRALIEILPMGGLITQALDSSGVFEKASAFVEKQLASLAITGSVIKQAVKDFIAGFSLWDLARPGKLWERAQRIFTEPIDRIISFATGLVGGIVDLVKDAILKPIAKLAEGTNGYALLKAVMGKDPITGEPVPQTAEGIIGPFMNLIGQGEIWENMKKANAIPRAFAWFKMALGELLGFVNEIPGLFLSALKSLQLVDIILIPLAFGKLVKVFGSFLVRFTSWAGSTIWALLEIIFAVFAPGVMPYIAKAKAAFKTILKDPIAFVGNLVRAGKLGFQMFASNIVAHLKNALIKWLTGPLGEAGVYIPKSFDLMEIVKLVLSVLGLTWQNIRSKLVKFIPDPVLTVLEKTAGILVTLVKDGPVAAWEQIKTELDEMKSQLISQVTQMITVEVVKAAVLKLVSMLNPAGAFLQAILAIYSTVTFFIEKINQIAAVVASFIDSISAIAAGQVDPAAKKVEQTMANSLTVIIAFLAKIARLGNIPEKLVGIVKKIRAVIDKGLEKIAGWLQGLLKKLVGAAKAAARRLLNWWTKKVTVSGGDEQHSLTFAGSDKSATLVLRSAPELPSAFLAGAAKKRSVRDGDSAGPIGTAETQEKAIDKTQTDLRKFDENDAKAASGKAATEADALMKVLDGQLGTLGGHIGTTLTVWGVRDGETKPFPVPRGSFTLKQKRKIAAQHKDKSELRPNVDNELVNLQKGLARRHVVSSADMAEHYSTVLVKKKWSEAKLLLEQRGSISESHTPVKTPLNQDAIKEAANQRYARFFGYAKNLFIGDSKENSSIQQHLDDGNPDLAGKLLVDHVRRIKRAWAIDGSFTETPVR